MRICGISFGIRRMTFVNPIAGAASFPDEAGRRVAECDR